MLLRISLLIIGLTFGDQLFAQAGIQSSTTLNSTLSSSTTVVAPPRYFVDTLAISAAKTNKAACPPPGKIAKITIEAPEHIYLGDVPLAIKAKSDDGFPVKLSQVNSDKLIKLEGVYVIPQAAGRVTLRADEDSTCGNKALSETESFVIQDNENVCISGLEQQGPPPAPRPDAAALVQYLGNPYPFSFQASDDQLLVYSAREPLRSEDKTLLTDLKRQIDKLLDISATAGGGGGSKPAYDVEVSVPHAAAFTDLAAKMTTLNYSDFKIQNVGLDKVHITNSSVPDCSRLTAYLRDIRHLLWSTRQENAVAKVFNFNASDITGAISGSSSGSPPSSSSPSSGVPTGGSVGGSSSPSGASGSSTGSATTSASSASISTSAATGAAPSVSGSSPAGSSSGVPGSGSSGGSTLGSGTPSSASGNPSSSGSAGPSAKANAVGTDMLVFSDGVPGDDAAIQEKKRLLALIDLPRPEMILNVWTMQASSKDPNKVGDVTNETRDLVRDFNDVLEKSINAGWQELRTRIEDPNTYFDPDYYSYLVGRYVSVSTPPDLSTPQETAQRVLGDSFTGTIPEEVRSPLGLCAKDKYCLGYTNLFQPIRPRLTDMLIALIAARNPKVVAADAINKMEGTNAQPAKGHCVKTDMDNDVDSAGHNHFFLECFREVADDTLGNESQVANQPSLLGLLRSALADFLFQYKVSQLYPHEFSAYELSQSAHSLNSALAPLIDAFNRDLAAYQTALANHINALAASGTWVGAEKDTFINKGMITVRTISGIDTIVNTTSQSFLDATQQPTLSALASSIQGAKQGATTGAHLTDVFQNLTPIQAQVLLGTLAAFQSSKVQIGRSMDIDVTPRSLSGADSAELSVKLNVDESAGPTYYSSSAKGSAADISRVATHDITTHIRVDSIKLFNVSTLTAELQKARTRFPLLPPFVEIPYIGTLVGIPLPPAKEFHSSSAIISAIIVPTASDIALGLQFNGDTIVDAEGASFCQWQLSDGTMLPAAPSFTEWPRCRFRRVTSYRDVDRYNAISLFHQQKMTCIANGNLKGNPTIQGNLILGTTDCSNLSLNYLELGAE